MKKRDYSFKKFCYSNGCDTTNCTIGSLLQKTETWYRLSKMTESGQYLAVEVVGNYRIDWSVISGQGGQYLAERC